MLSRNGFKVDFLIAGTQKGGTTALDSFLRRHPAICMPKRKELHFFDTDINFLSDQPDYDAYHKNFECTCDAIVAGESTPSYMFFGEVPRRIFKYNSRIKLIILLRNPIFRAYSHWNMQRYRNYETLPFIEALRIEDMRCRSGDKLQIGRFSYLKRSLYSTQVERLLNIFPKNQLFFIKTEYMLADHSGALEKIFGFLGVPNINNIDQHNIHALPYIEDLSKEDIKTAGELFITDIKRLEKLLNWDCSDWLSNYIKST